METTRLSSKGQLIIPKSVRALHHWDVGTKFVVEDRADGVLLKPIKPFRPAKIEEVFGCLGSDGPPKTIEDMDRDLAAGIRWMWEESTGSRK